ncbi:MAG: DUF1343 domain-containing protein [Bacteroidales bacterium]|nr:DUF1343 domain-containing protein [Bacteroidales bacterium]
MRGKITFGIALTSLILIISLQTMAQIRMGAERTEIYLPLIQGKHVGICGNHTSMIGTTHLADSLLSLGISIEKIFCPEHGFRGEAEAGAKIESGRDSKTGLPIISLYGKNKKPTAEQVSDLDVIIFDIQDVGCRFYTYISTLHYVMEAAAEQGVEVIILDRPNPNGHYVAGPVLEAGYRSFVGMHKVPVVHGMTIGEYGRMINGEGWLAGGVKCKLTVIDMEGYTHSTRYSLPVAPSPNLRSDAAILLYPSLCFFEGTCISVGRGTDTPFEIYGAPELSAGDTFFTPVPIKGVSENPPHKGEKCRGFSLSTFANEELKETHNNFTIKYLLTAYNAHPDKSKFFTNAAFFDKLAGTSKLREMIIAGKTEQEIEESWFENLRQFIVMRRQYLLYEE